MCCSLLIHIVLRWKRWRNLVAEKRVLCKCDLILPCGNIWLNQVKLYIQLYHCSACAFKPSPHRFTHSLFLLFLVAFTRLLLD